MNNNVNLIAFGTFGNPNGFTQTFFAGNPNKIKAFDIRGSILIYPKSTLYSIRKEYKDGYNMIAYSIYTYAQEPTSARGGSFIGSSILFVDKIAEENIIINNLNEFHNNLKNKNVQNDVIIVNHSDKFDVRNCKPKDFDKINFHLREIDNLNFTQNSNKQLVVYCETNPSKLQLFFKKSIDLLNIYDAIYFTDSEEVAKFVMEKGIFKLVQNVGNKTEFEQEIQFLHEERKRKIELAISEFGTEKQKLENDKKRLNEEYRIQIERNKQLHQENERKIKESETDLQKINQFYIEFSRKIDEFSNQLKSGKKLDDVKKLYRENLQIFKDSIGQIKKPVFTNSISKPKLNSGLSVEREPVQFGKYNQYSSEEREDKEYRIDIFKLATLVLLFLWVITLVYFLFFKKVEKETIIVNQPQTEQPIKENQLEKENDTISKIDKDKEQ